MGLFKKKNKVSEVVVLSPVDGKVKELSKVNDEVFTSEIIGKGIAVTPKSNDVYAPFAGTVKVAFPTGHAYGIQHTSGVETLVHIGVDTVTLNGKGFEAHVKAGDKVDVDSKLSTVDFKTVKKEAKSDDVIVLITNESLGDFKIEELATGDIKKGEQLFVLRK